MYEKNIVCVFAHPDDEAFGPGGTTATLAQKNNVYIICATNGDAGKNYSKETKELGEIRKNELLKSAKILGVQKVFFLGYKDGNLCNNSYHDLADDIKKIVQDLKPEILLTFENRGISGHIDHIAVSFVTTYVFLKTNVKELWYYCILEKARKLIHDYFIYFPPGYKPSEIDKVIDTENVWEKKVAAMMCHKSQIHDVERILANQQKLPKKEYFIVKNSTFKEGV